ncbi:hypothetical protein A2Z67_01665 [Candidatus Woesebacteria bacterium RBG_13_36_22]|uniref:Uncharacterized protein n=1 Tax=Candidatus Woesebacteria bacterium RBG_13_36_22 TaxID=1802478 RepID=A0A1F7X5Z0_9BACT|nr:MAG: hypothetical protein A2Z67_01665 [Candidatus Woesebacteria bacterium RBG_13_36_22]
MQEPLQNCLEGRSKSKKCDKQLTHIVRVICRVNFKIVKIYENFLVLSLISSAGSDGLETSFATFDLYVSFEGVANVVYSVGKVIGVYF